MFNLHLPTIEMIAGDTCPFTFLVRDLTHLDVTSGQCVAQLSISPYVNDRAEPLVVLDSAAISGGMLAFAAAPEDTVHLRGKYVYQLYLSNGRNSEIYSGHLIVHANRNPAVITG